jgi:hypothetical protein
MNGVNIQSADARVGIAAVAKVSSDAARKTLRNDM